MRQLRVSLRLAGNAPCWMLDSVLEDARGTVDSQGARDRLRRAQGLPESVISECYRNWTRCSKYCTSLQLVSLSVTGTGRGVRSTGQIVSLSAAGTGRGVRSTGHVYNLWPATTVSARIVAVNGNYEGLPSATVTFTTKEGGLSYEHIIYAL